MNIDLVIESTPPNPPSGTASYARVDNTTSPVYSAPIPFTTTPADITPNGVPNGQYNIVVTPTYADGRTCQPQAVTTPPCPNMTSVNAVQQGNNIVVNYVAPGDVTNVTLLISGPNGSTFTTTVTNGTNNSQITYPIPVGLYGDYLVTMQTVCDASTGFFGPAAPPISINVTAPVTNPILSGGLTVICGTNCGAEQSGALQFNLAQPLNTDLVLQIAYELYNTTGGGSYSQVGCSLIPAIFLKGSCQTSNYATVTIPAGVLSFTTPILQFANSAGGSGSYGLSCFCPSDPGYSVFIVDKIFLHAPASPTLQISLTPTDIRMGIFQV